MMDSRTAHVILDINENVQIVGTTVFYLTDMNLPVEIYYPRGIKAYVLCRLSH